MRPAVAEAAFYRLPLAAFGTQLLLAIVGIIVGLDAAWTDVTAATAQVEPQQ